MSINHNVTRRTKPALLIIGTAIIALLAAVAVPDFATAHTTTAQSHSGNYALRIDLGMNNHPLINPKSQLIHLISQRMNAKGIQMPSSSRHSVVPTQIRPDVWAGSVTVMAQTVF